MSVFIENDGSDSDMSHVADCCDGFDGEERDMDDGAFLGGWGWALYYNMWVLSFM